MKKITLSVALLLFGGGYFANAQVGIGTPEPATSSMLDIVANDKGVLIPRVELRKTDEFAPIVGDKVNSLMVYNTVIAGDVTPGYYYWLVDKWSRVINADDLDTATGPSEGDVIYTNVGGDMVFQYWDGNEYKTITFGDIVKANETVTTLEKKTPTDLQTGEITYEYSNEEVINDNTKQPSVINITADIISSITNNTAVQNAITNILSQGGNVFFTKTLIEAGTPAGQLEIPANSFYVVENGIKVLIDLDAIVKANESITHIDRKVTGAVGDGDVKITYDYFNEEDVTTTPQITIDVNADIKNLIEGNTEIQNAITKILNQGGNVYYTRIAIVAGDNTGGDAIPANSFYTVNENGVKVLIDLGLLVTDLETKTRITKVEDSTTGEIVYNYAHEANKPGTDGIATAGTPDVLNVTADMVTAITKNTNVQNAIKNILNQGGNVYYTRTAIDATDNDGTAIPADSFYTVNADGKKVAIDISGAVINVITNNAGDIKNILGDNINNTTVTKTGDTFNGGDVYIYANTTTIAANTAVTSGITIPAGTVPNTIIGIKVIDTKGISSNVTDIVITGQKIDFNIGTGNMYNILGAGDYDVIVEFTTAPVNP